MAQFEEMEEILEDERRNLEAQRMALASEHMNVRKVMESVKAELAKSQAGSANTLAAAAAQVSEGVVGHGTKVSEVPTDTPMDGDDGPSSTPNLTQLV